MARIPPMCERIFPLGSFVLCAGEMWERKFGLKTVRMMTEVKVGTINRSHFWGRAKCERPEIIRALTAHDVGTDNRSQDKALQCGNDAESCAR